jgi:asparagine N-glycosylation enzyme membrane subunit Stt3
MKIEHILALLFLIIVILSTSPTTKYLSTGDAWYHYRIAKYTLELGYRPSSDPLANSGETIVYPPFFHYFLAALSKISGLDVFFVSQIYPRLMALLIIAVVFLISREFFDERTSMVVALLQAMVPAFILQTSYGWGDHDALSLFLIYSSSLLFIKVIKNTGKKGLEYAILGGLLLGILALTWVGFPIFLILVWIFIAVLALLNSFFKFISKDLLLRISLFIFIGLGMAASWYNPGEILPLFEISIGVMVFATFSYFLRDVKIAPFLLFVALLVSSFFLYNFSNPLIETGLVYIGIKERGPLLAEIAELKKPTWGMLDNSYGIPVLIPILGILLLVYRKYKEIKVEFLFLLVWFASYLFIATTAARFIIYSSIFVSSLTAFLIMEISNHISKYFKRDLFIPVTAALLILVLMSSSNLFSILYNLQFWITDDRYVAFAWLRNNSNSNDVVMNWWDYSPWVNAIAERKTVVNNQPPGRFEDHEIFFGTDDWNRAREILSKYNVSYVTVDVDMLSKVYSFDKIGNGSMPYYLGMTYQSKSLVYANLSIGLATFLDTSSGIAWDDYGNGNRVYYKEISYFDSKENKLKYLRIDTKNLSSTDDFLVAYSNYFIRIPKETKSMVFFQLMYMNSSIPYLGQVYENQHMRFYKVVG